MATRTGVRDVTTTGATETFQSNARTLAWSQSEEQAEMSKQDDFLS